MFSFFAFLFSLSLPPQNIKAAQWPQEEAEEPKVLAVKVSVPHSNPASNQTRLTRSTAQNAPSYPEQLALIDTFRARIYPGVAGRSLMETYLEQANWNLENAIAAWRAARASLIASRPPPPPPRSPSPRPAALRAEGRPGFGSELQNLRGRIILRFRNPNARPQTPPPAPSQAGAAVPNTPLGVVLRLRPSEGATSARAAAPRQETSSGEKKDEVVIPFNDNFEQERRDAALALRLHLEERTGERGVMSPAEAVLLLHQHNWDLTQAAISFSTMQHARTGLARTYDQMRIPVQREIAPVAQQITIMQQSERLAELINLTGRNDWYSLRVALQERNWNLVATVADWYTIGIPPVEAPAAVAPYGGVRMDINLRPLPMPTRQSTRSTAREAGWAVEPEEFGVPSGEQDSSSSSDSEAGSSLIKQKRKRPHGFMINSTRTTAKKGMRNDQKFLIEYVSRGRYWFNRFERQETFRWPDVNFSEQPHGHHPNPDTSKLVDFDWNNQQHLHWLNNWRRQNIQRATGLQTREQAQRWLQEELDFLYALSEELLQELLRNNPNKTEDQLLPLKVTMDKKTEWCRRMNEKFAGTMQAGSSEPRRPREPSALMTQRSRTRAIVERFKVKPDEAYFAKVERKEKRAKAAEEAAQKGVKRRREEEDSDAEGILESDSEDKDKDADAGNDNKRARTSEGGED